MQFSTIKDIAESINMEAKELLADIKAVFGDEFPTVRDWKQNTKLPDDTITYRIMEYYGVKADIQKNNLPAQVPTTLPELIKAATPLQRSALQQTMQALESGFSEFFNIQVTKSVVGAYFDACDTAYDFVSEVIEQDLTGLQSASDQSYAELEKMLKAHYTSGSESLGKGVRLNKAAGERVSAFRSSLQTMKASLVN